MMQYQPKPAPPSNRIDALRFAPVLCTALAAASTALAGPVTMRCKPLDPNDARFCGEVIVTLNEASRHVRVAAPGQPDCADDYTDGRKGFVSGWSGRPNDTVSVTQFVHVAPDRIEFGWRSPDRGGIEVRAWVERRAIEGQAPCVEHLAKTYDAS